jgi:hypothetical protein
VAHWTISRLAVLALLLVATPPASATPVELALCDGLVTLGLPPGWRPVPEDVLELYTLTMAEASGGLNTETYQAALQPEAAGDLMALPRILIQVKETGRLPYLSLLELPGAELLQRNTGERPDPLVGRRLVDYSLDQLFFDRTRCAIRLSSTVTLPGGERVGTHTASFLTERGRFTLHCSELLDRFGATAPLFDAVIRSVRIAPPLAYRPRLSERWPALAALDWRHASLGALILGLGTALALALARQRRHRNAP